MGAYAAHVHQLLNYFTVIIGPLSISSPSPASPAQPTTGQDPTSRHGVCLPPLRAPVSGGPIAG